MVLNGYDLTAIMLGRVWLCLRKLSPKTTVRKNTKAMSRKRVSFGEKLRLSDAFEKTKEGREDGMGKMSSMPQCLEDLDYRIIGSIGDGTFSRIYEAEGNLAVKRNLASDHTSLISSVREFDALMRTYEHPHIVNLSSYHLSQSTHQSEDIPHYNRDDEIHFVFPKAATNLHVFAGCCIEDEIEHFHLVKLMFVHILLGLEYMHSMGMAHLDIKPANILLYPEEEKVALADLGTCYFVTNRLPCSMWEVFNPTTPTSRPPEGNLRRDITDVRADIWSVAMTIYSLLFSEYLIGPKEGDNGSAYLKQMIPLFPNKLSRIDINNIKRVYPDFVFPKDDESSSFEEKFKKAAGSNLGAIADYIPILSSMLAFLPEHRPSATELLDNPFFDEHRKYIRKIRLAHPFPTKPVSRFLLPPKKKVALYSIYLKLFEADKQEASHWSVRAMSIALSIGERYYSRTSLPRGTTVDDLVVVCYHIALHLLNGEEAEYRRIGSLFEVETTPEKGRKIMHSMIKVLDSEFYEDGILELSPPRTVWNARFGDFLRYVIDTDVKGKKIASVVKMWLKSS